MPSAITVHRSRVVPAALDVVYETVLATPLPQLYRRRFGPMPPIVAVREQQGEWTTPGQTRIFVTADGGEMREEMLSIAPLQRFSNRLTVLKGPFKPFVATIDETWTFLSQGRSTETRWEWHLVPRSTPAIPLVWLVGRLWLGYAGAVFDQLTEEVQTL